MRAIVYESGGVEALNIQEVPHPSPGPGEVLVRVRACAMNHLDVWATKDPTQQRFGGPRIMGSDVAGVVEALGPGASGFTTGDRVLVYPGVSCGRCRDCQLGMHSDCAEYRLVGVGLDGGYAELMKIGANHLVHLPESLSFEEGASIPLVFITAWRMLVEKARVQPGEWVLVTAAGSGVGIAAIQIAKLLGARVITTASTREKRDKGLSLGAEAAVDYTRPKWAAEVIDLTDGKGVAVCVDNVGGRTFADSVELMRTEGRMVNCGTTAGPLDVDVETLRAKRISFMPSFMGSNGYLHDVLRLVEAGLLKPVVHELFPFEKVKEAHRSMIDRKSFGKIVLDWPAP